MSSFHQGLAQGNTSVIGRGLVVDQGFDPCLVQNFDHPIRQKLVHKNASAQRHFPVVRTRKGILYHTKAGFRHGNMKLGGEYFRGLSSPVKIGQIQEKRGPIEDLYLVFRMSDKPTGSGGGGGTRRAAASRRIAAWPS